MRHWFCFNITAGAEQQQQGVVIILFRPIKYLKEITHIFGRECPEQMNDTVNLHLGNL